MFPRTGRGHAEWRPAPRRIAFSTRRRFSGSARIARSASRLNSAAPYRMHAWPPMSRLCTPCVRIVERTLRIGLGIKRTSQGQIGRPQTLALHPPLDRSQPIPCGPLGVAQILRLEERCSSRIRCEKRVSVGPMGHIGNISVDFSRTRTGVDLSREQGCRIGRSRERRR